MRSRADVLSLLIVVASGCATPAPTPSQAAVGLPAARVPRDSMSSTLIPAGLGNIKQDSISIILQPEGVRVSAVPLDESVIRVVAPDSYRTLHAILESKRAQIAQRAHRSKTLGASSIR